MPDQGTAPKSWYDLLIGNVREVVTMLEHTSKRYGHVPFSTSIVLLNKLWSFSEEHPYIMPPYILKELSKKEELDEIVEVILEAQYSPYVPSASLFFPVFGVSASDRQVTIEASKERLWKSHQANSASHWIFVEDLATNKIVAATQWELFLSNPFTSGSLGIEAYWWPEGEARSFCSALLRQAYTPRFLWMKRPHTGKIQQPNYLFEKRKEKHTDCVVMPRSEFDGSSFETSTFRLGKSFDELGPCKSKGTQPRRIHRIIGTGQAFVWKIWLQSCYEGFFL